MNILIGIGSEPGHSLGIWIGTMKGIGIVIGTDIVIKIGTGTGTESETVKDTGIVTTIGIMRGTELEGIKSEKEIVCGVMIMIGGLGTQIEKVAGIMTTAALMVVNTIVVGAEAGVEVGAGAGVGAKLVLYGLNHVPVHREKQVRRHLHQVI